jgi:hypothetical protein
MSCRTTPAGSAITSYARISGGEGIPVSDVGTLSLFHSLRREFQTRSSEIITLRSEYTPEQQELEIFRELQRRLPYDIRYSGTHGTEVTHESIYTSILDQSEAAILADEHITDARRVSLLSRISDARNAEVPDNATMFALARLYSRSSRARLAQESLISEYSRHMGITQEEGLARFRELENSIDRARTAEVDEYYTSENRDRARQSDIVDEAGSVRAYIIMNDEINERRTAEAENAPRLIDTFNVLESPSPIPDSNYELLEWAHDTTTGHAEFKIRNTETGEIEIKYHRAQSDLSTGMRGEYRSWSSPRTSDSSYNSLYRTPGEFYASHLRDTRWNSYRTEIEALEASVARQCALCGQFASMSHSCPTRFANAPRYVLNNLSGVRTSTQTIRYAMPSGDDGLSTSEGNFQVELPLVAEYRAGFRDSGLMLIRNASGVGDWRDNTNLNYSAGRSNYRVSGDFALIREEDGTITANVDRLSCTCGQYLAEGRCIHQDAMGAAAIARATPIRRAVSSMSPEERVQLAANRQLVLEAAARSDWTRNEETLIEAKRTWTKNSEVSYYEDYSAFETVYETALAEKAANGKPTIPYLKENAFGGLATRASGQGFGIELEYDFPEGISYEDRRAADSKIGQLLKEANITATSDKQGYHAAARAGYQDSHVDNNGNGTWSWEHDGSVAGEIVTPVMYDEPETWEKLEKVIDILKEVGAVPSVRAGAHVHVGTGALFGKDPKKYSELAKLYSQHEDVVYRISTDPVRGTHRGSKTNFNYASPNPGVAPSGFVDANAVRRWQGGRSKALNLNTVYFDDQSHKSHVEFRVFDSTLDAGSIQAQVKLAVSMTSAAARIAEEGATVRQREAIGAHSQREKARGRRRATSEDIKEDTSTFRSLMDTLFTRAVDKEQMTKLFAGSGWVKLTAAQRNRHGIN